MPMPPWEVSVASLLANDPGPACDQPAVEPLYNVVYPVSGRQSALTALAAYRIPPTSSARKSGSAYDSWVCPRPV